MQCDRGRICILACSDATSMRIAHRLRIDHALGNESTLSSQKSELPHISARRGVQRIGGHRSAMRTRTRCGSKHWHGIFRVFPSYFYLASPA